MSTNHLNVISFDWVYIHWTSKEAGSGINVLHISEDCSVKGGILREMSLLGHNRTNAHLNLETETAHRRPAQL